MRGKRAREIRKMLYGDYSHRVRGNRRLANGNTGNGMRRAYQAIKKLVTRTGASQLST